MVLDNVAAPVFSNNAIAVPLGNEPAQLKGPRIQELGIVHCDEVQSSFPCLLDRFVRSVRDVTDLTANVVSPAKWH
jgi:hypothetical protein